MRRTRRGRAQGGGASNENAGGMRWLLTYSDLITLLLAFFIILYSISRLDVSKFQAITQSLKMAFNGRPAVIPLGKAPPTDLIPKPVTHPSNLQKLFAEIQHLIQQEGLAGHVSVAMAPEGIVISFFQPVLFASGSATLRPAAKPVLMKVAALVNNVPNQVNVRGYTNNVPIHTGTFPSNWELSAGRALTVLHFLVAQGAVAPTRLRATAFGQYHPFVPNTTRHNLAENRRVELVILRKASANGG